MGKGLSEGSRRVGLGPFTAGLAWWCWQGKANPSENSLRAMSARFRFGCSRDFEPDLSEPAPLVFLPLGVSPGRSNTALVAHAALFCVTNFCMHLLQALAPQDGWRTGTQNGRTQGSWTSLIKAPFIWYLASSFHSSGTVEPTEAKNKKTKKKLIMGMVTDLETLPKEGYGSKACISGSHTPNLSEPPMKRWREPGNQVHRDIYSWINLTILEKSRYFFTFINKAIEMIYLFTLRSKTKKKKSKNTSLNSAIYRNKIAKMSNQANNKYQKQMASLCWETEIHYEKTAYYRLKQNGIIELANRTICKPIYEIFKDIENCRLIWHILLLLSIIIILSRYSKTKLYIKHFTEKNLSYLTVL